MKNSWKKSEAEQIKNEFGLHSGNDVAQCTYVSRLIGHEPDLVLHGGGNTSVKTLTLNIFGDQCPTIFVKASGSDLANISSDGFSPIELTRAKRLRSLPDITQDEMNKQLRLHLMDPNAPMPSVEAFLHVFIPAKFIVHTHPATILGLTNQPEASRVVNEVFGKDVISVPYTRAGFGLAKQAADTFDQNPKAKGMILLQHGLVTWGESADEAYEATINLVNKAEQYWRDQTRTAQISSFESSFKEEEKRYVEFAPLLRGLLAEKTGDSDHPFRRFILVPLITAEVIDFLNHPNAQKLAASAPLTPDHLVRTKSTPLFISNPAYDDAAKFKEQLRAALKDYEKHYNSYYERHSNRLAPGAVRFDAIPRVLLLPGIGAVCAGVNERAAIIARDITEQSLSVKRWFALSDLQYQGIEEEHLFDMEYLLMQQAKVAAKASSLERQIALVTGAVGAIGMGITEALLQNGCHVAITDLAGENLDKAAAELKARYPNQVFSTSMDVSDPKSIEDGIREVIRKWGGIDLMIINAGVA
ncbi:SDR family NAD(P)-dependent oxidoreductase, partial [bacterium]|nr:SDR family NAD(P)-dependent oxidoreductase [bacterium]